MNVLLLGCGGNAGLNYVRCLKMGDKTIQVYGLDTSSYAAQSSNVDEFKIIPNGITPETVIRFVENYPVDFIHAQPDNLVEMLLRQTYDLPITKGSVQAWRDFSDKLGTQKRWWGKGIGSVTHTIDSAEYNWDELTQECDKVWVRSKAGAGSKCALPVKSFIQALNWIDYWVEVHGMKYQDFMLSEFLPGPEYAVQMFYVDGELRQVQARERVEYFFGNIMPSGQSSTPSVARTVNNPEVLFTADLAVRTIQPRPHGIYGVDMKSRGNGDLVPTEVNYGRYYTTSNFFAELGMNTPYDELILFKTGEMPKKIAPIPKNYYWMRGLDKLPVIRTPDGTIQKTT